MPNTIEVFDTLYYDTLTLPIIPTRILPNDVIRGFSLLYIMNIEIPPRHNYHIS
jgi:hypothetical protein